MAKKDLEQHYLFQDLPCGRNGKFHSTVLTTYSIDLIEFDNHILKVLNRKQIHSVNIFADQQQVMNSLEYTSPKFIPNIGREYCVTNVSLKGAFHPKINFFVGDEGALVLIGSGNLTVAGQGKNHEVFTGFMIDKDDDTQKPLVIECWNYLKRLANRGGDFEKRRIKREIPENCTFLKNAQDGEHHLLWRINDDLEGALLYHEAGSSILSQLTNLIPMKEVTSITIASPFFDEDGESLVSIASLCPKAQVQVLIQENCQLPPCKIMSNPRINFYDFDKTKRGQTTWKNIDRQAHAKIFHFVTQDKTYCIIGSANATKQGLGTLTHRGMNEEFCVLYASNSIDFLDILGIKPKKKFVIRPQDIERQSTNEGKQKCHSVDLKYAIYENQRLRIKYELKKDLPSSAILILDNGDDLVRFENIDLNEEEILIETILEKTYLCYLWDRQEKLISNKIFINQIERLDATNPSTTSRALSQIVSRIENEGYNTMEIVDMLSSLMMDIIDDSDKNYYSYRRYSITRTRGRKELPEINLNVSKKKEEEFEQALKGDYSSSLLECIEEAMRKKSKALEEDLNDEEELANVQESNERSTVEKYDLNCFSISKEADLKQFAYTATKILKSYCNVLNKRIHQMQERGALFATKDDFNFFSLAILSATQICGLNRANYDFGDLDQKSKSYLKKKLDDSLNSCLENECLSTLEKFQIFCMKYVPTNAPALDEDYRYKAQRAIKYALIYATMFFKYSTNQHIRGNRIKETCKALIEKFGHPSLEGLRDDLGQLSQIYNGNLEFRDVERTLKNLGL